MDSDLFVAVRHCRGYEALMEYMFTVTSVGLMIGKLYTVLQIWRDPEIAKSKECAVTR